MKKNITIKEKVLLGLGWTYAEKFLSQGVALIISVILARLIAPQSYGVLAIIGIFTSLASTFAQSGISSAIIQKERIDSIDYSTAYLLSLFISFVLYIGIFLLAPLIAKWYKNDAICIPLQVMGLSIIISSYNSVQQAYVSRNMQFKKFFFATIIGTVLSGTIGILLAYHGEGVWALVVQSIASVLINSIVLFFVVPEKPKLCFSISRMIAILSFGWKILTASLINNVWNNIVSLLVGKKYSSTDLAYYTKGQQYPLQIYLTILSSMETILYPVLSEHQDKDEVRLQIARRSIQVSTYIMTPIMVGLAAVSYQLVELVLTKKWLPCVPYMILMFMIKLVQPIKTTCYQNLKAIGRAEVYLKQEIIRKAIDLSAIIIAILAFDSPLAIMIVVTITYYLTTIIDAFLLKKYVKYMIRDLISDTLPALTMSIIMAVCIFAIGRVSISVFAQLAIQILTGAAVYVILSIITMNMAYKYIKNIITEIFFKERIKHI